MGPYRVLWDLIGSYGVLGSPLCPMGSYGALRVLVGRFGLKRRSFGVKRADLGLFGVDWSDFGAVFVR